MRARLALSVTVAAACGRSALGEIPSDGTTSIADSSGSVQDPLTGGDPGGEFPPPDPTVPTTVDEDATSEPPDPSGPDPSIDTGWIADFASACGNGELGAGEECDDGNYDDDDACTSSCTIPFEVEWTVTHNGGASGFDAAHAVVIDEGGNIVVAGDSTEPGQGRNVWVQQYLADGTPGWTFTWDGIDGLDDTAHAIDMTPDGDFILAGSTESNATGDDILVMRMSVQTLTPFWTLVVDGPGSGPEDYEDADEATDVVLVAGGDIIVGGRIRVGSSNSDAWIRRLDGTSAEVWTMTYDGPSGGNDRLRDLALTSRGQVVALAEIEDDEGLSSVVWALDEFQMLSELGLVDTKGAGIAWTSNDAIVIAGNDDDYDIRSYTAAGFELQWSSLLDSANDDDEAHAIAAGDGDMTFVVGESGRDGQQENGRLYAIDDSGHAWWGEEHNGGADLRDAFLGVAVDPFGDVVVVGLESVLGEQTNALVRKYHPL